MKPRSVPPASSAVVRKRMQSTRQKNTAAEMSIRRAIHRMGLRYRIHIEPVPGLHRNADIVFSKQRVAVMIDGCFWHGCELHGSQPKTNAAFWSRKIEDNKRRDRDTDERLRADGWRVIRIWEHEDPQQAAERIASTVRNSAVIG